MYSGFNVKTSNDFEDTYEIGKRKYDSNKRIIENELQRYIDKEGKIDGSKLQENWFPNMKADVFISHSHKDERKAIGLAGWLFKNFGLESFIDSCVWGFSNDLLRQIDNKYCLNPDSNTYNYEMRNFSTSHVHMMLSAALTQMIDNTECIFFLNTENSLSTHDTIKNKTNSPWIYSEIVITQLIRKKSLWDYRKTSIIMSERASNLDLLYNISLDHLEMLDDKHLDSWVKSQRGCKYALDNLYLIANPKFKSEYIAFLERR